MSPGTAEKTILKEFVFHFHRTHSDSSSRRCYNKTRTWCLYIQNMYIYIHTCFKCCIMLVPFETGPCWRTSHKVTSGRTSSFNSWIKNKPRCMFNSREGPLRLFCSRSICMEKCNFKNKHEITAWWIITDWWIKPPDAACHAGVFICCDGRTIWRCLMFSKLLTQRAWRTGTSLPHQTSSIRGLVWSAVGLKPKVELLFWCM